MYIILTDENNFHFTIILMTLAILWRVWRF